MRDSNGDVRGWQTGAGSRGGGREARAGKVVLQCVARDDISPSANKDDDNDMGAWIVWVVDS